MTTNTLFICNQNKNRSKTAEEMMKDRFNTKSAGLFNDKPVQKQTIAWADTIIVMEEQQRKEIAKRFPREYLQKRILNLNIPDIYKYDQKELKEKIKENMKKLIKGAML
ncbi:MAG: phosphotyrosine protein phosphatase [Nanoarchaeota archaeon]